MKKFTRIIAFVSATTLLLASCGNNDTSTTTDTGNTSDNTELSEGVVSDVKLDFVFMTAMSDATRTAVLDDGVAMMQQKYPNVNFINDSGGDYGQKMKLAFSSGQGYDLVFVDDLLQQTFVEGGYLMDLTPYMGNYDWVERSAPGAVEFNNLRTPDKTYSIGTGVGSVLMYYNQDIYDEVGLEIPTTLAEFESNCDKLVAAGYIPIEGDMQNGASWLIQSMLLNNAPKNEVDDWYYCVNSSQTVQDAFTEAGATIQNWIDRGFFRSDFVGVAYDDTPLLFARGETAMALDGNWRITAFESSGINVNVFAMPGNTEPVDEPYIVGAIDAGWALNAELDEIRTQIGLDFIDVMMSDELAVEWYEAGMMPTILTDYSNADASPLSKEFLEATNNSQVGFFLDNVKPGYLDVMVKETQLLISKEKTPEQFSEALQEEWEK